MTPDDCTMGRDELWAEVQRQRVIVAKFVTREKLVDELVEMSLDQFVYGDPYRLRALAEAIRAFGPCGGGE